MTNVRSTFCRRVLSRVAYSRADFSSWMEQGPTMASSRRSFRSRMFSMLLRALETVSDAFSVRGFSFFKTLGTMSGK
jgi:hypothetical protein